MMAQFEQSDWYQKDDWYQETDSYQGIALAMPPQAQNDAALAAEAAAAARAEAVAWCSCGMP
jgi:hypothetical protein